MPPLPLWTKKGSVHSTPCPTQQCKDHRGGDTIAGHRRHTTRPGLPPERCQWALLSRWNHFSHLQPNFQQWWSQQKYTFSCNAAKFAPSQLDTPLQSNCPFRMMSYSVQALPDISSPSSFRDTPFLWRGAFAGPKTASRCLLTWWTAPFLPSARHLKSSGRVGHWVRSPQGAGLADGYRFSPP